MNVSAGALEENLTLLKSKDLISFDKKGNIKDPKTIVRITKRGIRFLSMYNSINVKYLTIAK